jgi:hypothetical protein
MEWITTCFNMKMHQINTLSKQAPNCSVLYETRTRTNLMMETGTKVFLVVSYRWRRCAVWVWVGGWSDRAYTTEDCMCVFPNIRLIEYEGNTCTSRGISNLNNIPQSFHSSKLSELRETYPMAYDMVPLTLVTWDGPPDIYQCMP